MSHRHSAELLEDVAAASAAYLYNMLPRLVELPAKEVYRQLAAHFEAALCAYRDSLNNWTIPAEPSRN